MPSINPPSAKRDKPARTTAVLPAFLRSKLIVPYPEIDCFLPRKSTEFAQFSASVACCSAPEITIKTLLLSGCFARLLRYENAPTFGRFCQSSSSKKSTNFRVIFSYVRTMKTTENGVRNPKKYIALPSFFLLLFLPANVSFRAFGVCFCFLLAFVLFPFGNKCEKNSKKELRIVVQSKRFFYFCMNLSNQFLIKLNK